MLQRFMAAMVVLALASVVALAQDLPSCPPASRSTWTHCRGYFSNKAGDYIGEFEAGKINGFGTFRNRNGNVYSGNWKDAKFDGFGTLTYADGHVFSGEWKDSKRDGRGRASAPDGEVLEGLWRDNKYVGSAAAPQPERDRLPVSSPPISTAPLASSATIGEVGLKKEHGTFKIPVLINGVLTLDFTVDSGASDVSIPADVVLVMMRTGTLTDADFLGTQTFILADGTKVPSRVFRIRTLKVGNKTIENVVGSMSNLEGSLLLGQSFLSRFNSVSFDYGRQVLVLK